MSSVALKLESISKNFGGVQALSEVSLSIDQGEFVGMIGPNGAGKTTLFNVVSGVFPPDHGTVRIFGHEVTRAIPEHIARLGVARTFQLVELFDSMSVAENVATVLMVRGYRPVAARNKAYEYLERVDLEPFGAVDPSELPFANRRKLELARALALEPKVLLADEVMAGLAPEGMSEIIELMQQIVADGMTVVAVEHNLDFVMRQCPRVVVLDRGRLIADGTPEEVVRDPAVIEAYVGDWSEKQRLAP